MEDLTDPKRCVIMVSRQEKKLLTELREVKYGQVVVYMDSGQPVRIEKIKESIKL